MDPLIAKPLQEHFGIFLFALFVSLITTFIAWYKSYFRLPPQDVSEVKLHWGHLIGAFAIYFLVAFAVSTLASWYLNGLSAEAKQKLFLEINAVKAWINLIAMAVVLVALLIYLQFLGKNILQIVVGQSCNRLRDFGMGIVSWLISFPLVIAMSQFANMLMILFHWQSQEQIAVRFFKSTMPNPVVYIITCIFVVLIIPLIEEIIFRGFLQNWLLNFFGRKRAIIITAIIFSLFHFSVSQGYGNVEIIPTLFVLACFLGFIYARQKSIYASWGLHATFNGINVLFMSIAQGTS